MSIVSAIVILLLALSSGAAAEQSPQVFINTAHVELQRQPIISGLVVMMPLHDVLAYFEGGASWDPGTGVITVGMMPRGSTTPVYVELRHGQASAKTKDRQIPLEAPPRVVDGWIYVPLNFFRDALGAVVDWDETTRSICISVPLPPSPLGMPERPPRYFPRMLPARPRG